MALYLPARFTGGANWTLPAAATDILRISSFTAPVAVRRIRLWGNCTTTADWLLYLIRRNTGNSGAASNFGVLPKDTRQPSQTAAVVYYAANPSALGSLVGIGSTVRTKIPAVGANLMTSLLVDWDFRDSPIILPVESGSGSQSLVVNANAVTPTGGVVSAEIDWDEGGM